MNDSEKNAMLVLQKMCDIKSTENTIVAETINTIYNLINRQQAEIDRLSIDLKAMRGAANSYKAHYEDLKSENLETIKILKTAKSEAVREFAEKLKEHSCNLTEYDEGGWSDTVSAVKVEDIDRLFEEMGCNDG